MPHEAIYQYIYALPKDELAKRGIMLRSKRSSRKPRPNGRKTGARIVVMVSIDDLVTKGAAGGRQDTGRQTSSLVPVVKVLP